MSHLRHAGMGALAGAALGALFLGLGGRLVMRLLATIMARETAFSIGGSLEVIAYGAIVGLVAGALVGLGRSIIPGRRPLQGLMIAVLGYAGTLATLPAHIAETARPFAGQMAIVHLLFGSCFLLFGLALARVSSRASSPAQAAAPAAPRE